MTKNWNTMTSAEKGEAIRKVIYCFEEEDMRVSKIAIDEVNLPVGLVHDIIIGYLTMVDKLNEKIKILQEKES